MKSPPVLRRVPNKPDLLHLKVPNHGRVFRALLRAYLGAVAGQNGDVTAKPARPLQANGEA
jgi:hypothetical protein